MAQQLTVAQARGRLRWGQPGKVRNQSQRNEPRPFLNCRFWAWLTQAWWAGLRWEGGAETAVGITELLRRRSGRPEFVAGVGQGTSAAELARALEQVFPWMATAYRMVPDEELLAGLGGRFTASLAVNLARLPARLQRFSGGADVNHQVALAGGRVASREVRYVDPLGPDGYAGDWEPLEAVRPALVQRSSGRTFCTLMEAGDPMLTTIRPVEAFAGAGATGRLPRGSHPTFRVNAAGRFVRAPDAQLDRAATVTVGYVARVDNQPARSPSGRFYFVTDGPAGVSGRFVRATATTLERPKPTGDVEQARAAGRTEGYQAAVAEFRPLALPDELYVRERL